MGTEIIYTMKAKVTKVNGIFIMYDTEDGRWGIDDSTYNEIMNKNEGDEIELSAEREMHLKRSVEG